MGECERETARERQNESVTRGEREGRGERQRGSKDVERKGKGRERKNDEKWKRERGNMIIIRMECVWRI